MFATNSGNWHRAYAGIWESRIFDGDARMSRAAFGMSIFATGRGYALIYSMRYA